MPTTTGSAPAALQRVRAGWGLRRIALHELLGERAARPLTLPARQLAIARAKRRLPPLRRWEQIPDRTFKRHATGGNAVRLAHVLDLVPSGCRIVDIGIGHGYVTGVLLRDRGPAHYCGVDLRESRIAATRAMIEANDLGDRHAEFVVSDVFDLDDAFWRQHEPDLVLLLEVLEHLPDPGAVLRSVAAGVQDSTRILFTVPLYGRLESVWGHQSVFDHRRLVRLCREAGLAIERAEPLQSRWSLVLARPNGQPHAAAGGGGGYEFSTVAVPAEGDRSPSVRLEMPNPRIVRIDVGIEPADDVRRLRVAGLGEHDGTKLVWEGPPEPGRRATYVLRPGRRSGSLAAVASGDPEAVRWIEVSLEPVSGAAPELTVHRAAYVANPPRPAKRSRA